MKQLSLPHHRDILRDDTIGAHITPYFSSLCPAGLLLHQHDRIHPATVRRLSLSRLGYWHRMDDRSDGHAGHPSRGGLESCPSRRNSWPGMIALSESMMLVF